MGRKVRLLLSTFAIVLDVASVAGTLVFPDTLSRSFTGIFASSVGDVSSFGLFVVDQHGKLVGGNGPPGIAVSYDTAPAAHGLEGLSIVRGRCSSSTPCWRWPW